MIDGGDHKIFLGEVQQHDWDGDNAPLVFQAGEFNSTVLRSENSRKRD